MCKTNFEATYQGVKFSSNHSLSIDDMKEYLHVVQNDCPDKQVNSMTVNFHDDCVDIDADTSPVGFEHIRRITGYLVGSVDKFNDGKKAEEKDRVKHLSSCACGY